MNDDARGPRGSIWESRWLYPAAAVLLIGAVVGVGRCPVAHASAHDFTLPVVTTQGDPGSDRVHLLDQRGHVVVLDFWATWCGPCQATTPALERLYQRYHARGLVVVGINVDQEGPALVPAFERRFGVDYPVVWDGGQVSQSYDVTVLPTLFVIDRQGRIQQMYTGVPNEGDLVERIERLL